MIKQVNEHTTVSCEDELRFFKAVWNNSEDNLFIVLKTEDGDFITERTNPALVKLFQLTPEQASGASLKAFLPAEAFQKIAQRYNDCLQNNAAVHYEESHVLDDSGGVRYWETMLLPIIDEQTGEQRVFGISREFTRLKRIEEQLKLANERLEEKVKARTKELEEALQKMEKISIYDKLTKLYNRHKLDDELTNEINFAKRYGNCFGLILMDVDNFKTINDSLGHVIGDKVLVEFADVLKQSIRQTDIAGRWGGDEFLIIVPKASRETILHLVNTLQKNIKQHKFEKVGLLTLSIGGAVYKESDDVDSIIQRADRALYKSKNKGKDNFTFE